MGGDLIFYQFSRSKVEQCEFSHFLSLYAPDKLPEGRRLQEMMNMMMFIIEGWDDDPREIHMVPEIRRFYSAFHDAWPYWLYFCYLDLDTLKAMTMCCLPSVNTMQVDGRTQVAVNCDPLDLLKFIKRDFMPMNLMCVWLKTCAEPGTQSRAGIEPYLGRTFSQANCVAAAGQIENALSRMVSPEPASNVRLRPGPSH